MSSETRRRTFEALVGLSQQEATDNGLPTTITLPDLIHGVATRAVLATIEDGRERSALLHIDDGRWKSGALLRGPRPTGTGLETRGNRLHNLINMLREGRLYMHTHPGVTDKIVRMAQANLSTGDKEPSPEVIRRAAQAIVSVPSSGDAGFFTHRGSAAFLIPSGEGTLFLGIHQQMLRGDPDIKEKADAADQQASKVRGIVYRASMLGHELPLLRQAAAETIAGILSPQFACYFSSDIANPTLQRLEPRQLPDLS